MFEKSFPQIVTHILQKAFFKHALAENGIWRKQYMNKNAIKKFAIEARKKLIDSVTDKAGMLGITEKSCSEPIIKGADFEVYQTVAGTEVTLNKRQCEQRRRLASQIESRGFEAVVEEVAYTWFNRICAIRFMEVNDYLPNRVRVLSSEKEGKMEPDLVTQAPDVDLDLTAQEKEEIINWKLSGTSEDTDKLYGKLFLKKCHQLHDILPGLFEADSDYMELLFGISYTNKDDVIYMLVNPETGIPEQDFNVSTLDEEGNPTGQVEIIGWLYQYYNTELKDDTFAKLKKNVKITKERIPAATQLFTPDWIVRYMVENSVGRIWIEHLRAVDPSTDEKATAERFGWKYYLPEAEQEETVNVKLAEIRTTYKELKPTDITCIDGRYGAFCTGERANREYVFLYLSAESNTEMESGTDRKSYGRYRIETSGRFLSELFECIRRKEPCDRDYFGCFSLRVCERVDGATGTG